MCTAFGLLVYVCSHAFTAFEARQASSTTSHLRYHLVVRTPTTPQRTWPDLRSGAPHRAGGSHSVRRGIRRAPGSRRGTRLPTRSRWRSPGGTLRSSKARTRGTRWRSAIGGGTLTFAKGNGRTQRIPYYVSADAIHRATQTEKVYEDSIEAYKDVSTCNFVRKWRRKRRVRMMKRELRLSNRLLRAHYDVRSSLVTICW